MIVCVEDDEGIRNMMIYTLNAAGLNACGAENGKELFDRLKENDVKLILLDIMLPGENGIDILKKLKQNAITRDIPVIMATAKGTEFDKVTGLDMGADDYLAKPFGMMEMVSRVRAVLRRVYKLQKNDVLVFADIELNDSEHSVKLNGENIEVTLKEYEILKLFMHNPGRVFTRDELLSIVWGEDFMGETRTVDVHIGTLRTKLGDNGQFIKTLRGVGYKMEEKL